MSTWTHFEEFPDVVLSKALTSAKTQEWQDLTPKTAVERLRILFAATPIYATLKPDQIPQIAGHIKKEDFLDSDSLWIASTLMRTAMILTPNLTPVNLATNWETHSGEPAKENKGNDSALPPIIIVTLAIVGSALIGFVAVQAKEVIDKHLARNSAASEMNAAHASAIQMVGSHRDAEIKSGKSLPWSQQELDQIAILETRQRAALKSLAGLNELPPPFLGAIERGFVEAVETTVPILILLFLLFFLKSKKTTA